MSRRPPGARDFRSVKAWLAWIAGAILFVPLFYGTVLGLYGWRIMHSDLMVGLRERSFAYACIGPVHDAARPRAAPERQLARYYLLDGFGGRPPQPWWLKFGAATYSIELWTSDREANRMYAALPYGHFQGFNSVARHYAGRDYCALDPRRRQAVIDLYWWGRRADTERVLRGGPALDR